MENIGAYINTLQYHCRQFRLWFVYGILGAASGASGCWGGAARYVGYISSTTFCQHTYVFLFFVGFFFVIRKLK